MEFKYKKNYLGQVLSAPFIFFMIVPIVFLDITFETYHQICFRLLKIPLVKRSAYIKIDRHKLQYLNFFEKIFCAYCGYANGLLGYAVVIAAKSEKYWCGIKHQKDPNFKKPKHHKDFAEYGSKEEFNRKCIKNKK